MLGARITALLEESRQIEDSASRIQGTDELLATSQEIAELEDAYTAWFARALDLLPTEYEERFRSAYEGSWYSSKIKAFLQGPGDPSPMYNPENPLLAEYWSKPFQTSFRAPLMEQRQVLLEAKERIEGTGETSQHIALLERMCRNFHAFARPLKDRGRERQPFVIEDEYDVQTLVDAALRLVFDDVRPEDYVPEYAGGKSRVDFLLRDERIVIETKMTRTNLRDRDLGEELLIDIARYKTHPTCSALVVLIYDRDQFLANPRGLEHDLSRKHDGLAVFVYVTP